VHIEKESIKLLIHAFSDEPGVRSLERSVHNMCRKIAFRIMLKNGQAFYITAGQYKGI